MPLTKQEVEARLTPDHLSTDKLREEIEHSSALAAGAEAPPATGGKLEREYGWQFRWTDGRGKVWEGEFRNKVLSVRENQMVGVLRARLAAGVASEVLDPYTTEINLMIAHLTYSLVKRPDWAKDLQDLLDVQLLQQIYLEVADHEATFLGRQPAAPEGKG